MVQQYIITRKERKNGPSVNTSQGEIDLADPTQFPPLRPPHMMNRFGLPDLTPNSERITRNTLSPNNDTLRALNLTIELLSLPGASSAENLSLW